MFTADSRYAAQPVLDFVRADGEAVRYVAPRILPAPESFEPVLGYRVSDSDRLDLLAWKYLGAPTLSWRIADANRASHPGALPGAPGDTLSIATPGTGAVAG